jgi:hypothetical protein
MEVIPVIAYAVAEEKLDHLMCNESTFGEYAQDSAIVLLCEAARNGDVRDALTLAGFNLCNKYGDTLEDPVSQSFVSCVRFQQYWETSCKRESTCVFNFIHTDVLSAMQGSVDGLDVCFDIAWRMPCATRVQANGPFTGQLIVQFMNSLADEETKRMFVGACFFALSSQLVDVAT